MVHEALALGEADRVHENHDVELARLGEEAVEVERGVGELAPGDVGIDLHAAQAELLHAALELGRRPARRSAAAPCPEPTKRSGQVATISASRSLIMRDTSRPRPGSAQ